MLCDRCIIGTCYIAHCCICRDVEHPGKSESTSYHSAISMAKDNVFHNKA